MSHLDAGVVHAMLDGEIPSSELPPIQAHLAACAECRALFEEERRLLADADAMIEVLEVPAEPLAPLASSPHRSWARGLAWAATLIAAVGVGYMARGWRQPVARQTVATGQPAPLPLDTAVVASNAPSESGREQPAAGVDSRANVTQRRPGAPVRARKEAAKASVDSLQQLAAGQAPRADSTIAPAREVLPAAPAPGAAAPPATAPALGDVAVRANERKASGALQLGAFKAIATPESISLPDAVRRLNGSLRLIDGLIPLRLEAQGSAVRVVYAVAQGELVLSQRLIDGRVEYTLIAPPGFPTDSLARLRSRVRE